ncbi:hypothetical protein M569_01588 [Genlisea aurea]|uniref:Uncharacterized protein n=1 Tax=Genlisea aurea TaxID=192259 RepID=S8EKM9_9LAMI|nr:hypothetical protein M569_01588 [Genlisea aurea]
MYDTALDAFAGRKVARIADARFVGLEIVVEFGRASADAFVGPKVANVRAVGLETVLEFAHASAGAFVGVETAAKSGRRARLVSENAQVAVLLPVAAADPRLAVRASAANGCSFYRNAPRNGAGVSSGRRPVVPAAFLD